MSKQQQPPSKHPSSSSSHVRVVIRTRPTSSFAQDIISFDQDKKSVHIHIPKNQDWGFINNQQEHWDFKFDSILHNASQDTVYEECGAPIVKSVFDGYNGTILAYGQTGAGKTFTMTGATENYKHRGIIPRSISHLFREITSKQDLAVTVRVSYMEIYNEQIIDLLAGLSDGNGSGSGGNMSVVEEKNGATHVKGLTVQLANTEEEALNLLFEGETNRSISHHDLNTSSSRSHCIFTVHIETRSRVESDSRVVTSKLNLVDLAGSERLTKTRVGGEMVKETMYINRSLTYLEQVIIALSDKRREHVPYRQSKLTHVLKDALGGNCRTVMISTVYGDITHIDETISTLRFSTRMMCVTVSPVINQVVDPVMMMKRYETVIRDLKLELAMHDMMVNRGLVTYEPYTDHQKHEVMKQVREFIDGGDDIEVVSLRHVKEVMNMFRYIVKCVEGERDDVMNKYQKLLNGVSGSGGSGTTGGGNMTGTVNVDHEIRKGGGVNGMDQDDTGVGDMEGIGFGVGVSPGTTTITSSTSRQKQSQMGTGVGGNVGKSGMTGLAQGPGTMKRRVGRGPDHDDDETAAPNNVIDGDAISTLKHAESGVLLDTSGAQVNGTVGGVGTVAGVGIGGVMGGGIVSVSPQGIVTGIVSTGVPNPSNATNPKRHGLTTTGVNVNGTGLGHVSRADEFEAFKIGKGADMWRTLLDNKMIVKEKRRYAREICEKIGHVKREIMEIKSKYDMYRSEPSTGNHMGVMGGKESVGVKGKNDVKGIDKVMSQPEYDYITRLNTLKHDYKTLTRDLGDVRSEIEYMVKVTDTCRNKVMSEFETWYEAWYGTKVPGGGDAGGTVTGGNGNGGMGIEDVMDIGEKFDRLQMERMSMEDPDSLPYYNAKKNTERRNGRGVKRGGGMGVGSLPPLGGSVSPVMRTGLSVK